MKIPLLKALQKAALGSRRALAVAIIKGNVSVNGTPIDNLNFPLDIEKDKVAIGGKKIDLQPKDLVVLMLNKPRGIISTTSDEQGRQTVIDLLPEKYRGDKLYPVGRLDKDSTGLLLLTNDGDLAYKLTHPRFEHEKEYRIRIRGELAPGQQRNLEEGVDLEDGRTYPAKVARIEAAEPYTYSMVIHEGRKRQVRRMFESQGHSVITLHRVRIGALRLGNLPESEARPLTAKETRLLLAK
jgi:23S rRNA pseudouridine2605 synthase